MHARAGYRSRPAGPSLHRSSQCPPWVTRTVPRRSTRCSVQADQAAAGGDPQGLAGGDGGRDGAGGGGDPRGLAGADGGRDVAAGEAERGGPGGGAAVAADQAVHGRGEQVVAVPDQARRVDPAAAELGRGVAVDPGDAAVVGAGPDEVAAGDEGGDPVVAELAAGDRQPLPAVGDGSVVVAAVLGGPRGGGAAVEARGGAEPEAGRGLGDRPHVADA